MRRDVNPMINAMLILEDMASDDSLEVRVKDFGMFAGSHAMGLVGPQVIAKARVQVTEEVLNYQCTQAAVTSSSGAGSTCAAKAHPTHD